MVDGDETFARLTTNTNSVSEALQITNYSLCTNYIINITSAGELLPDGTSAAHSLTAKVATVVTN